MSVRLTGFVFAILWASTSFGFEFPRVEGEWGLIGRDFSQAESYFEPKFKPKLQGESQSYFFSARLRAQADSRSQSARFEIRDSYYQLEKDSLRARIGFQSLAWGETYGLFIADLPNPRDWSDPRLLDIAYVKKPVFMAQLQWFGEVLGGTSSAQVFFTPITRSQQLSQTWSQEAIADPGAEGGLRLSRLFELGLDASFFLISHLDRTPVPVPERTLSTGLTGTQSIGDQWILRTDQVWRRSPLGQDAWEWQGVGALHWAPTASLSVAGQLQRDPGSWGASGIFRYQGFVEGWDFDGFAFFGLERSSYWVQPKLTYSHPRGLSVSIRYDWVESYVSQPSPGVLGERADFLASLPQDDRILVWISQRF